MNTLSFIPQTKNIVQSPKAKFVESKAQSISANSRKTCLSCKSETCDGKGPYAVTPDRKMKMGDQNVNFINILLNSKNSEGRKDQKKEVLRCFSVEKWTKRPFMKTSIRNVEFI